MRFSLRVALMLLVPVLGVLGLVWLAAQPAVGMAGGCGGG